VPLSSRNAASTPSRQDCPSLTRKLSCEYPRLVEPHGGEFIGVLDREPLTPAVLPLLLCRARGEHPYPFGFALRAVLIAQPVPLQRVQPLDVGVCLHVFGAQLVVADDSGQLPLQRG
jgi:hypothetical protein